MDPRNDSLCFDLIVFGNCTRRKECLFCNDTESNVKPSIIKDLDVKAQEYIPKKKLQAKQVNSNNNPSMPVTNNHQSNTVDDTSNQFTKLKFNLDAEEYVPRKNMNNCGNYFVKNYEDDDGNVEGDELEIIMKDIMDDEELSDNEEEDKWWPKYQNCECCKGYIYRCSGKACEHLDSCYCKIKDDVEDYN